MNKFAILISGSNEEALSQIAAVAVLRRRLNKLADNKGTASVVPTTLGEAGTLASKAIPTALSNVGYLAPLGAAALGGLSLYRESRKPKERRRYSNALVDAGIGGALGSVPWLAGHLLANGDTESPETKTWGSLLGRLPGMAGNAAITAIHAPGQVVPGGSTIAGAASQPFLYRYLSKGNPDGPSLSWLGGKGGKPGGDLLHGWSEFKARNQGASGVPGDNISEALSKVKGLDGTEPSRVARRAELVSALDNMTTRQATRAAQYGLPSSSKGRMLATADVLKRLTAGPSRTPTPTPWLQGGGVVKHWRGLASLIPAAIGAVADSNLLGTKD